MEITRRFVYCQFLLSLWKQYNTYALDCNYNFTNGEGIIESPGYPKPYSNGINCSWRITVPAGRHINLITKRFELEYSYNCGMDALYIYDGLDENAKLFSKPYCGVIGPESLSSTTNSLFIRFIADDIDNAKGFSIQYNSVKICDYEFHQPNGTFMSPNFPDHYFPDANCSYKIITNRRQIIVLQFHSVLLENQVGGICLDYVSIYDILNSGLKLLRIVCGNIKPFSVRSSSNQMLIKFHSDNLINEPGFNASFYSLYHLCRRNEYQCLNGECIYWTLRCNGVKNCKDNSDESFCQCKKFKCEDGRCVDDKNTCQNSDLFVNTLAKQSNSIHATSSTPPKTITKRCAYSEYNCNNTECIAARKRCNGENDCGDNSDESSCYGQCRNNNGDCEQICTYNLNTGVKCSCYNGFTLDSDQKSCIDINECSSRPCAEFCTNTGGSYECGCRPGYRLHEDKKSCVDFNECSLGKAQCEQRCINKVGSFECACYEGYTLLENTCDDVDECSINNGGCAEKCLNTIGSFYCTCNKDGYRMVKDNVPCVDVDECELGVSKCSQVCVNKDGGYECACAVGYYPAYDGFSCLDINECHVGKPGCWGVCINTVGSYRCTCNAGFVSVDQQTKCKDINECLIDNGGCADSCVNTRGSFRCECHEGYVARDSKSFTCIDENECDENPCQGKCINYVGTFRCQCDPGYTVVNRTKCQDVNECLSPHMNDCEMNCTNIPGSYFCSCPDRYTLDADQVSCKEAFNSISCKKFRINSNEISENEWTVVSRGWAWQASLSVELDAMTTPRFNCMGVLVGSEFVLTSSRCLRFGKNMEIPNHNLLVSMGGYAYGYYDGLVHIHAKQVLYHEHLELALVQLVEKVDSSLEPMCLPQGKHDVDLSEGSDIVAATWSPDHRNLMQMAVKVNTTNMCSWNNEKVFTEEDSICVKFGVPELILPMSGSPLLGILRGTSNHGRPKWLLTGFLIRGAYYPDSPAFRSQYVGYQKASTFADWVRSTISKNN